MKRMLVMAAFFGLAAVSSGCLLKETSEVWYVDASGGVTWVITEADVRSDANNVTDRQQEESVYWLAVQQQRHSMAMGLQELGGAKVKTTVLRSEVPYTVRTEARFTGLDEIGRRLLAAVGALGESSITRDGQTWEWKMVARDPKSIGSTNEPSDNASDVLVDLNSLKVVLTAGKFVSAEGFTISNDGRIATFDEKFADSQADAPVVTIKLVWK